MFPCILPPPSPRKTRTTKFALGGILALQKLGLHPQNLYFSSGTTNAKRLYGRFTINTVVNPVFLNYTTQNTTLENGNYESCMGINAPSHNLIQLFSVNHIVPVAYLVGGGGVPL